MSFKTHVGSEKCEKLHGVIFFRIRLKISGNCSGVFLFLSVRHLKQNCKLTVLKVRKTSRDIRGERAGALSIHYIEGQGGVFHDGPGVYLEDLKPILLYPTVI